MVLIIIIIIIIIIITSISSSSILSHYMFTHSQSNGEGKICWDVWNGEKRSLRWWQSVNVIVGIHIQYGVCLQSMYSFASVYTFWQTHNKIIVPFMRIINLWVKDNSCRSSIRLLRTLKSYKNLWIIYISATAVWHQLHKLWCVLDHDIPNDN